MYSPAGSRLPAPAMQMQAASCPPGLPASSCLVNVRAVGGHQTTPRQHRQLLETVSFTIFTTGLPRLVSFFCPAIWPSADQHPPFHAPPPQADKVAPLNDPSAWPANPHYQFASAKDRTHSKAAGCCAPGRLHSAAWLASADLVSGCCPAGLPADHPTQGDAAALPHPWMMACA